MSYPDQLPFWKDQLATNDSKVDFALQYYFAHLMRVLLYRKIPPNTLTSVVRKNRSLYKHLHEGERRTLNRAESRGYDTFDLPLIYKLIKFLDLVPKPTHGWDNLPNQNDITIGDDVERIYQITNEIILRVNNTITDLEFKQCITLFKDVASRLETYLEIPKGEFVSKLENLERLVVSEERIIKDAATASSDESSIIYSRISKSYMHENQQEMRKRRSTFSVDETASKREMIDSSKDCKIEQTFVPQINELIDNNDQENGTAQRGIDYSHVHSKSDQTLVFQANELNKEKDSKFQDG